jgi:arylsulfatase A-like enzyme
MPPHVLCVVLDTARADAFEPYGAPAGSTPTVADLAARGRADPSAFAAASWTLPSHAAMFTGLMPRAAGLAQAPGGKPFGARPVLEGLRHRLVPEVLRRAGYHTAAVSSNLWITERSGFATGFDEFVLVETGRQAVMHRSDRRSRLRWALAGMRARSDDGAGEAGRVLARMVDERPRRPCFWFVNLTECHSPYLPPRPYNDLSALDRMRAADEARRHLTLDAVWRACAGGFDVPDDALERMRHLYRRSVRSLDDWLARVLEHLDGAGILDDTLVIVTSDHGENFGEGELLAHAFSLDDRLVRVPFVVAGPGAGENGDSPFSLAALPRFLADAAGLVDHPWSDDLPTDVALAQFDPPAPADDERILEAVARWGLGDEAIARITTPFTAVTDGRRKLVRAGSEDLLYELESDPLELAPLALNGARGRGERGDLAALWAGLEHPAAQATAEPAVAPTAPVPQTEMAQLEEQMRLLGYM